MAKSKSVWVCQNCGAESPKWIGRCPVCGEWNTYVEERITKPAAGQQRGVVSSSPPRPLTEVSSLDHRRLVTGTGEFNRVLGGGIVPGTLILLGGEPGIGKSTLALQVCLQLSPAVTLYVSGEESAEQIKLRADRLQMPQENVLIYAETRLEEIIGQIRHLSPQLVIIDSIQTITTGEIESAAGTVSQIRESAGKLLALAKETGIPILLIGHITKEGTLAGPKVLEHIVDVVLHFEGDPRFFFRILRVLKNRFGSASELALFEMKEEGLQEILNPSELLLSHLDDTLSGIATAATIDGARPFLIEIQALVSTAVYGTPQRSTTGFDIRRLHMLLAVLEKRAGFRLSARDVFLNIAGGLRVDDPAIDLAVTTAILSSYLDIALPPSVAFAAEIGLSGEVRPVTRMEQRISEAARLGFKKIMISGYNAKKIAAKRHKIEIITVKKMEDAVKYLFNPKTRQP
jgi:DNA repair protein RadA/Sms